jgi:hypothetical protein
MPARLGEAGAFGKPAQLFAALGHSAGMAKVLPIAASLTTLAATLFALVACS